MRPVLWRKEGRRDAMITNEGRWRTRETQKTSQKVFEICAKGSCSVKCWHLSSAKALVVAEPKVQRHISFNNPQLEKQVVHMVLRKVLKWSCFTLRMDQFGNWMSYSCYIYSPNSGATISQNLPVTPKKLPLLSPTHFITATNASQLEGAGHATGSLPSQNQLKITWCFQVQIVLRLLQFASKQETEQFVVSCFEANCSMRRTIWTWKRSQITLPNAVWISIFCLCFIDFLVHTQGCAIFLCSALKDQHIESMSTSSSQWRVAQKLSSLWRTQCLDWYMYIYS